MTILTANFNPLLNYTIAATTSSTNQVIGQPPAVSGFAGNGNGHLDIFIQNGSSGVAYVKWGMSAQTAVVGGLDSVPVMPGMAPVFHMGEPATNVAVILGTGTGNVYVSIGSGS